MSWGAAQLVLCQRQLRHFDGCLQELDTKYPEEMEHLVSNLPEGSATKSLCITFLPFLYIWDYSKQTLKHHQQQAWTADALLGSGRGQLPSGQPDGKERAASVQSDSPRRRHACPASAADMSGGSAPGTLPGPSPRSQEGGRTEQLSARSSQTSTSSQHTGHAAKACFPVAHNCPRLRPLPWLDLLKGKSPGSFSELISAGDNQSPTNLPVCAL